MYILWNIYAFVKYIIKIYLSKFYWVERASQRLLECVNRSNNCKEFGAAAERRVCPLQMYIEVRYSSCASPALLYHTYRSYS